MFWFNQVSFTHSNATKKPFILIQGIWPIWWDRFFFLKYTNLFLFLFYIILSIYKKSECLEITVFLICSTCIVSPAIFKITNYQFFTSQNKILQNYNGIMKMLCYLVVFLENFYWFGQHCWVKIHCFIYNFFLAHRQIISCFPYDQ